MSSPVRAAFSASPMSTRRAASAASCFPCFLLLAQTAGNHRPPNLAWYVNLKERGKLIVFDLFNVWPCSRESDTQRWESCCFCDENKDHKNTADSKSAHVLGLVRGSGLAHQADLSSKASSTGILEQAGHSVVVQVVDKVTHTCFMGSLELRCRQRV